LCFPDADLTPYLPYHEARGRLANTVAAGERLPLDSASGLCLWTLAPPLPPLSCGRGAGGEVSGPLDRAVPICVTLRVSSSIEVSLGAGSMALMGARQMHIFSTLTLSLRYRRTKG